jgi:hypothetical protein
MQGKTLRNHLVRSAVVPLSVGLIALGVPAFAVLSSSSSAGAATASTAASDDPVGDLVTNVVANLEYDFCTIELSTLNSIERTPGFCVQPAPLGG